MVFTKQARKNSKGQIYAPGKADINQAGYFDRNDYIIFKLCENYDGQVKGGMRKSWCAVKQNLSLNEAKALLEKRLK